MPIRYFQKLHGRTTIRGAMLHHDNATPRKAEIVTEYLQSERVELLPHSPYSLDLAPCGFFLFPQIKKEKVLIMSKTWQGQFKQLLMVSPKRSIKTLSRTGRIGYNVA